MPRGELADTTDSDGFPEVLINSLYKLDICTTLYGDQWGWGEIGSAFQKMTRSQTRNIGASGEGESKSSRSTPHSIESWVYLACSCSRRKRGKERWWRIRREREKERDYAACHPLPPAEMLHLHDVLFQRVFFILFLIFITLPIPSKRHFSCKARKNEVWINPSFFLQRHNNLKIKLSCSCY